LSFFFLSSRPPSFLLSSSSSCSIGGVPVGIRQRPAAEGEVCDLAAEILGCFRPAAWFAFAKSKFREKTVVSQRRCFNLPLAAMPEKTLDQINEVVDNMPEGLSIRHSEGSPSGD
jgi:hypothetical protein